MAAELGIDNVRFGWVFGVFTLGYAALMIPSGRWADRFGPRAFLALIVAIWSILTLATALVSSLVPLVILRFLFGLAESGTYPTAARAIYSWTPVSERGRALGFLNAGSRIGAAIGLALTTLIVAQFGWRSAFVLLGIASFGYAIFWWFWYRNDPAQMTGVSSEELALIQSGRSAAVVTTAAPHWSKIVLSRRGTLLALQYGLNNFIFFVGYSWLLPYLQQHFHLSAAQAGVYAGFPLYCGAFATWFGGNLVDRLYGSGRKAVSRLGPAITGFLIALVGALAASLAASPESFVAAFAVATFGVDLTMGASWTTATDMGAANTGAVSGAMNMLGSAGSFACSLTFPYLLERTGDARAFLWLAAGVAVCGVFCWLGIGAYRVAEPNPAVQEATDIGR